MIKNEKQYQTTKKLLIEFKEALAVLEADNDVFPTLKEIQKSSLISQILTFEEDIKEYEELKTGKCEIILVNSINGLQEGLIKARIANGYSQAQLANILDLKEQQVQRYESTNYEHASFGKIIEIFDVLGIEASSFKLRKKNSTNLKFLKSADIDSSELQKANSRLRNQKCVFQFS